jgi:hypothetical protein
MRRKRIDALLDAIPEAGDEEIAAVSTNLVKGANEKRLAETPPGVH